jgi:hypothetical protein
MRAATSGGCCQQDIQLQDLAQGMDSGISLPEAAAILGGCPECRDGTSARRPAKFALGIRNIESSTQIGGIGGAGQPFSGFTGGNWGPGETLGGYDTKTGASSDITGFE